MLKLKYFHIQNYVYQTIILPLKKFWLLSTLLLLSIIYILAISKDFITVSSSIISALLGALVVSYLSHYIKTKSEEGIRIVNEVKQARLILCFMILQINVLFNIQKKFLKPPHDRFKIFLIDEPEFIKLTDLVCFMDDAKFASMFDIIKSDQKSLHYLLSLIKDRNFEIEHIIQNAYMRSTDDYVRGPSLKEIIDTKDHEELYQALPPHLKSKLDHNEQLILEKNASIIQGYETDFQLIQNYFIERYPFDKLDSTTYFSPHENESEKL